MISVFGRIFQFKTITLLQIKKCRQNFLEKTLFLQYYSCTASYLPEVFHGHSNSVGEFLKSGSEDFSDKNLFFFPEFFFFFFLQEKMEMIHLVFACSDLLHGSQLK